jgi:hypothetical protein
MLAKKLFATLGLLAAILVLASADAARCLDSAFLLFDAHNAAVDYFYGVLPQRRLDNPRCDDALNRVWTAVTAGSDKWQNRQFEDATTDFEDALEAFKDTYDHSDSCFMQQGANNIVDLQEAIPSALSDCDGVSRSDTDNTVATYYEQNGGLLVPEHRDFEQTPSGDDEEEPFADGEDEEPKYFDLADAQEGFWVFTRLAPYLDSIQNGVAAPFSREEVSHMVKFAHSVRKNQRALAVVRAMMQQSSIDLTSPAELFELIKVTSKK